MKEGKTMKSLNDVLKELEKINREEPDSVQFILKDLIINYRKVNKTYTCKDINEFEEMARGYLVTHLKAKVQNSVWNKYTFPINDLELAEQFYKEDRTIIAPKYKEIEETWL